VSQRKDALNRDIKVRLTAVEKDLLRREAARMKVDMSVYCRSVIVDALTRSEQAQNDALMFQRQVLELLEHVIRIRALVNADLIARYPEEDAGGRGGQERMKLDDIIRLADDLQSRLDGEGDEHGE
jgi:hypothetical protein